MVQQQNTLAVETRRSALSRVTTDGYAHMIGADLPGKLTSDKGEKVGGIEVSASQSTCHLAAGYAEGSGRTSSATGADHSWSGAATDG